MILKLEDAPWSEHAVLGPSHRALQFLLPGAASDGVIEVAIERMQPHGYAAEHAHPWRQMFYVLKGQVRVVLDGQEHAVGPQTMVYIAPNVMHGVWQIGDEEVERLVITVHTHEDPAGQVVWKHTWDNPEHAYFQKGAPSR